MDVFAGWPGLRSPLALALQEREVESAAAQGMKNWGPAESGVAQAAEIVPEACSVKVNGRAGKLMDIGGRQSIECSRRFTSRIGGMQRASRWALVRDPKVSRRNDSNVGAALDP